MIKADKKLSRKKERKMEERKNNTGLVVLITVLVMLVLGMGAFIIYDKVINKTNEPNSEENNNKENNKEENSNTGNQDNQLSTPEKYSYKLVPASVDEIEKINNILYVWEGGVNNQIFGMTGFSGSFSDNKTIELQTIDKTNTIKFSSSVISYNDISFSNICDSLNCKNGSLMQMLFLLDSGELYFCNNDCLLDAKSEEDMQLLITDKNIESTACVDDYVFVKTADGIKKIVYSK